MDLPVVKACGGSWMVPNKLTEEGNFDAITELAKEALTTLNKFCRAGFFLDSRYIKMCCQSLYLKGLVMRVSSIFFILGALLTSAQAKSPLNQLPILELTRKDLRKAFTFLSFGEMGELTEPKLAAKIDNPSFIAIHPNKNISLR